MIAMGPQILQSFNCVGCKNFSDVHTSGFICPPDDNMCDICYDTKTRVMSTRHNGVMQEMLRNVYTSVARVQPELKGIGRNIPDDLDLDEHPHNQDDGVSEDGDSFCSPRCEHATTFRLAGHPTERE